MKAGRLVRVRICVDPTIITTDQGTSTYNVLVSRREAELDRIITAEGWVSNNGFYYAPEGWDYRGQWYKRREAPRPPLEVVQPFYWGFYVADPRDQRRDALLFTPNEKRAELILIRQLGWKKQGGGFTYNF